MEANNTMENRCTATNRQGDRCGKPPIPGGTVCRMHGGGAPQVKAAAQARLASLIDPAIDRLTALINSTTDSVALAAVRDVLDRTGLKTPDQVEIDANVTNTDDGIRQLVIDRVLTRLSTGSGKGSTGEPDGSAG